MRTLSTILSSTLAFSLLLGGFFVPLEAKASFLSSIFGNEVSASTDTLNSTETNNNSQNMALLQANISAIPVFKDKKTKDTNTTTDSSDVNDTTNILSNNALLPVTGPLGVSDGTDVTDASSDQTSVYVVRKGDSISQIADMFGVSVNTILWANDMKKGDKLIEGNTLFILPISGLEHTVVKGQTLKSIAKLYKVDVGEITIYNNITEDTKLAIGDKLMIPGAEMADEGGDKPAPNLASAVAKDKNYYDLHPIQSIIGYFINPVPTGHKTQGLHGPGHRGIDIGAPKWTPIYAAAAGLISIAHIGWSGGYGNMLIIEHPNGTKTLYAHMTKIASHTGDQVAQGQVVGYVGSTGRSTGPHLHFEVFNAKNPGADWSWRN